MEVFVVIIAMIAGVALGWRFKVFVLVPAIFVASGVIILTSHGLDVIALTLLSTVVVLQIGYFVGAYLQARTAKPNPMKENSTVSSAKFR
jgi:hypothetical protein